MSRPSFLPKSLGQTLSTFVNTIKVVMKAKVITKTVRIRYSVRLTPFMYL